jgi:polo-like kinase 1
MAVSIEDLPNILIESIPKPNGEIMKKHYSKGYQLGKGAFASVFKLTCTETNEQFAGKIIPKAQLLRSRARQKLMSEIKIHRSLHHTHIVRFHSFFESEDFLFILMELCNNHTLSDLLRRRKRLTELEAQCYLLQIIDGLQYLHKHQVLHRDIKLGNIFIAENMEIKIGDFGLAAKLEYEGERKRTVCGTPNFMAPEILEGKFGHSYECDVWSVGVVLYTLLIGKPPFETRDVQSTYKRIKLNMYSFPEKIQISEEAKQLISSVLVTDYTRRPNFEQILQSEFFTRNIIPKVLPSCVLAVPPSRGYINQFESRVLRTYKSGGSARALTPSHGITASTPSPPLERPHSGDAEKPLFSETKPAINYSAYREPANNGPDLWIQEWVDYSNKYGLGYLDSNNVIGVLFNDKTKMISDIKGERMKYIGNGNEGEKEVVMNKDEFPQDLYKKVMLLKLFKKLLVSKDSELVSGTVEHYLKNWVRTSHAVLFRMSNKVIQVCFNDKSELLFSNQSKNVTYIDKIGEIVSYPISTAIEIGNTEMVKRLKYAKEVLVNMLKGTKPPDLT